MVQFETDRQEIDMTSYSQDTKQIEVAAQIITWRDANLIRLPDETRRRCQASLHRELAGTYDGYWIMNALVWC